jgi:hypothetical protein
MGEFESRFISVNQAKRIKNPSERAFSLNAIAAGFLLFDPPPIYCNPPVPDKNGDIKKTITKPDFEVVDPTFHLSMLVEVTNGGGHEAHKLTQRLVVEQAGVENYTLITGNQITQLQKAASRSEKREILFEFFNWNPYGD